LREGEKNHGRRYAQNRGKGDVAGFTEVGQAPNARFFVDFLNAANALPDVQPSER
jgi:hypothetical protein